MIEVIRLCCCPLFSLAVAFTVFIIINALFYLITMVLTTNWLPEEDEEDELNMEFNQLIVFLMPGLVHHQPDLQPLMEYQQFLLPAPAG